jgi:hypothetical protein
MGYLKCIYESTVHRGLISGKELKVRTLHRRRYLLGGGEVGLKSYTMDTESLRVISIQFLNHWALKSG